MKTYNLDKIQATLLESIVPRTGKSIPTRTRKTFLESVNNKVVLSEGSKEILGKLIDDVMFFFKNPSENNSRVMALLNVYAKTKALGGLTENTPSLTKTIEMFSKGHQSKDRLKDFIRYWLTYILSDYKGFSPFIAFNKEVFQLERALERSKGNQSIEGPNKLVEYLLSNSGIIPFLKKISSSLEEALMNVDKNEESKKENPNIQYDRFPRNVSPTNPEGDVTDKFTYMQNVGMPKTTYESIMYSLLEALAK